MSTSSITSTTTMADPSSLRAAALKTIKRKRQTHEKPMNLPSRPPPPTDMVQLDYGQDDSNSDSPPDPVVTAISQVSISDASREPTLDQVREEGEISDEEGAISEPRPNSCSDNAVKITQSSSEVWSDTSKTSKRRRATPPLRIMPLAPSLMDRISISESRPYTPSSGVTGKSLSDRLDFDDYKRPYTFDAYHVRPGLPLTQEEYDIAKDHVLDLLGWGVHPEYLIDCGLTREIVFYVFTELNLRLPWNLDTAGLIPYASDIISTVSQQSPLFSISNDLQPRQIVVSPSYDDIATDNTIISATTDLHDIERQRKQELLARKAVQASRKSKRAVISTKTDPDLLPATNPTADLPDDNQDVEMSPIPLAPSETVESFLNSISSEVDQANTSNPESSPQMESDAMDVDDVPGLTEVDRQTPLFAEQFAMSPTSQYPPSADSNISTFVQIVSGITAGGDQSLDSRFQYRRGTKRPVASDFVDIDPPSSRASIGILKGDAESGKRKNGSANFSNVSMRRCIIDLSDTEDEEEESHARSGNTLWDANAMRSSRPSPVPTRLNFDVSRRPTPLSAIFGNAGGRSTGTMSPAALQEKEQEIRKMRELIAQREESRLRKLAAATSRLAAAAAQRPSPPVIVKQEEDEAISSSSSEPPENGSSDAQDANGRDGTSTPTTPQDQSSKDSSAPLPDTSTHVTPINVDVQNDSHIHSSNPYSTIEGQGKSSSSDIQEQPEQEAMIGTDPVDVDLELSTSAQVSRTTLSATRRQDENLDRVEAKDEHEENYGTYKSPFEFYPLLRSGLRRIFPGNTEQHASAPSSSFGSTVPESRSLISSTSSSVPFLYSSSLRTGIELPDLEPLKLATASKLLDPSRAICRYEIPGGGVCRDEGCEEVHLSRITGGGVEPSDEDTAEYLSAWTTEYGISRHAMLKALLEVKLKNGSSTSLGFEERVGRALVALGPPPPAPPPT